MNIQQELHWHEGLFLCPHHLQQFQHEISKGFTQTIKSVFDFSYGILECDIDNERLNNENVVEFKTIKALMPSGYYIDNKINCYIPPLSLKDILKAEDKSMLLYLGLPFWEKDKANLSSREEIKNEKISRIYSVTELEHSDENTGHNHKSISMRKLNPRIFSDNKSQTDYELIPLLRIKRGELQKIVIDNEFSPPCFKISGSYDLKKIIKNTIVYLINHSKDYRMKLHNLYEFKNSPPVLQIPTHKLKIVSSYSTELNEIVSQTNPTPFSIFVIFKKLLAELSAIIPDYIDESVEYNHDNPYVCFNELNKKVKEILEISLIKKNYIKNPFIKGDNNVYNVFINEKEIDEHFDYFIAIKTKISAEYLVKKVEEGSSFKLLPASMLKMKAVPGFNLSFVSNLPEGIFREQNEYYFIIKKFDNDLWDKSKEVNEISIIERLNEEEGTIDEINMLILHGGNQ